MGVRLPEWMIDKLDELGDRTEHTEKAVSQYLKKIENKEKSTRQ